ncbi:hypothetical protein DSO57_1019498 [Entomophthora muscae]|uniref:Uncharacterized protein n=1 Tax=Entomophthora muscae TaxID=34485 RepID=A0ACC2ST69_9FUNG|nr:hypothetical protein DSO57_1019498 [Entomophthora muscae]
MGYDTNSAYPPNHPPPSKFSLNPVFICKVTPKEELLSSTHRKDTLSRAIPNKVTHSKGILSRGILNRVIHNKVTLSRVIMHHPQCKHIRPNPLQLPHNKAALMVYALAVHLALAVAAV